MPDPDLAPPGPASRPPRPDAIFSSRWEGAKLRSLGSQASQIVFVPLSIENHPVITFPVVHATWSCRNDASLKRQWDETELKLKDFFECECAAPDRALPRDISDGSFAGNPVEQFLSSICTYVGTNDADRSL
jgi:hypothetical protein